MSLRALEGLYLAGQINGTTVMRKRSTRSNGWDKRCFTCAQRSNFNPFILNRADAYIGVMIDDLVVKGAPEPYRMFTSRDIGFFCVLIMLTYV